MSVVALSLCIPTNGIVEWVVPVLSSIYAQNVPIEDFEVVLCNNSNNSLFEENESIKKFLMKKNLHYFRSNANGFLNQIFSFKQCSGRLIKFVNHRRPMLDGSIKFLIDISNRYKEEHCNLFFTNLGNDDSVINCCDYNDFIAKLGILSSWSGGVAFWKNTFDFSKLTFDEYFPHFCLLYGNKDSKYMIVNEKIFDKEVESSALKKGKYDVFFAFSVRLVELYIELLHENKIVLATFKTLYRENFKFIVNLYVDFILLGKECSYVVNNYKAWLNIFYSLRMIKIRSYFVLIWRFLKNKI